MAAPYLAVPVSYPGIQPSRDAVVVDIVREKLVQRMEAHFDPDVSDEEMVGISLAAIRTTLSFDALTTRRVLSTGRGTWRRSPPRMLGDHFCSVGLCRLTRALIHPSA